MGCQISSCCKPTVNVDDSGLRELIEVTIDLTVKSSVKSTLAELESGRLTTKPIRPTSPIAIQNEIRDSEIDDLENVSSHSESSNSIVHMTSVKSTRSMSTSGDRDNVLISIYENESCNKLCEDFYDCMVDKYSIEHHSISVNDNPLEAIKNLSVNYSTIMVHLVTETDRIANKLTCERFVKMFEQVSPETDMVFIIDSSVNFFIKFLDDHMSDNEMYKHNHPNSVVNNTVISIDLIDKSYNRIEKAATKDKFRCGRLTDALILTIEDINKDNKDYQWFKLVELIDKKINESGIVDQTVIISSDDRVNFISGCYF